MVGTPTASTIIVETIARVADVVSFGGVPGGMLSFTAGLRPVEVPGWRGIAAGGRLWLAGSVRDIAPRDARPDYA